MKDKRYIREKYLACRAMRDHYKALSDAGIGELHFANLQQTELLATLEEIFSLTDDGLLKAIIENSKNRYNLNKLCHTRSIFGNNPKTLYK